MLPAPGETSWPAAVVERERSVAGEVLERNGQTVLDCRKRVSMAAGGCVAKVDRVMERWRERRAAD